jgi:hypothetical protein
MDVENLAELAAKWGSLKIHTKLDHNFFDSDLILKIINSLTHINNLIVNNQMFTAGCQLGRLQGDLVFLMEQMEEIEKKGARLKWNTDTQSK